MLRKFIICRNHVEVIFNVAFLMSDANCISMTSKIKKITLFNKYSKSFYIKAVWYPETAKKRKELYTLVSFFLFLILLLNQIIKNTIISGDRILESAKRIRQYLDSVFVRYYFRVALSKIVSNNSWAGSMPLCKTASIVSERVTGALPATTLPPVVW